MLTWIVKRTRIETNTTLSETTVEKEPTEGLKGDESIEPQRTPWLSYTMISVCVLIWGYFAVEGTGRSTQPVIDAIAPSASRIWAGAYWGLVTSGFVHFDMLHLLFNMWWAREFGRVLEPRLGEAKFLFLSLFAAVVSAGTQLALSDQTGIGFSGAIYAYFGYTLAARHSVPAYQKLLNAKTIQWMLGWLVLCVGLTLVKMWNIANAAHFAGLFAAFLLGTSTVRRMYLVPSRVGLASLAALTLASVVYMPWAKAWQSRGDYAVYIDAERKAKAGDAEAQYLYGTSLLQYRSSEAEGESWLKKSADQGHLPAMNDLAWRWATDSRASVRNGPEALKWAELLCKSDDRTSPTYIDTLAACYAELGQWERAIGTQEEAIQKLSDQTKDSESALRASLERYMKRQRTRETHRFVEE